MVEISQKKSFTEGFGDVLRSSAIFYVKQSGTASTTISFMDYWKEKRGLNVAIVANTRAMDGKLLSRQRLRFVDGEVINLHPDLRGETEGSIEIEVLSTENLAIPYPAIMAFYETRDTISMVHSYARAYSRHEVENGQTLTRGEESNWTMRDTDRIRSFCVFHNGPVEQPAQTLALTVRASDGRQIAANIALGALVPYQSVKLYPADHIQDLAAFLKGSPGQASLSFRLCEGFTRMLVGNEAVDGSDIQITHSDFNFQVHRTDLMSAADAEGLLHVPSLSGMERWVVVYPEQEPGRYSVDDGRETQAFASGEFRFLPAMEDRRLFVFKKADGALPTRINVGIGCRSDQRWLPAEPSLGIVHDQIPAKRMTWGPCAVSDGVATDVVVHAHDTIFGPVPDDVELSFRLFSARHKGYRKRLMKGRDLARLEHGVPLQEIFPDARDYLGTEGGYFTLFSEYGGLKAYVLMRKPSGSATFEHCF